MELILAILFFSLAAAVCVQMFVGGHILSDNSVELNHAVVWCETMAETFYSCDGDLEKISNEIDNSDCTLNNDKTGTITCLYDERYKVNATLTKEDSLLVFDIVCQDTLKGDVIYNIKPKLFPKTIVID